MAITEEQRALLKQRSTLEVAIEETTRGIAEKKREFEALLTTERNALNTLQQKSCAIAEELFSLKERGILYCRPCNELYEMSETRFERREGEIAVDYEETDYDKGHHIYAPGVEFSYYCPRCNALLSHESKKKQYGE